MSESSSHPDVLDVLVVGGGPGGTATAFRAAEHGLGVLVVDYDDLMKRIRDYSKDKLILPSFGGGDAMAFPRGGDLISSLSFDPIDKDEMCARWKALYSSHGVASRTGVEVTGLQPRGDGSWEVQAWDHRGRCDAAFRAKAVVLAVGRGVPRRFDIPGNTDGIGFRLDDPSSYVGEAVCVIGGGTSAAEAVIALSNAKAEDGDSTAVYWSYRGDRMPRVSKALAEVFFSAYIGNGNIRYFPRSEPAAVVTAGDRRDYLAIRTDRRELDGRPNETTHLEFPKESCVACIGEDIPEALLDAVGCPLVCGGPKGRKRMVVSRYLESRQSGVYVVGDLLSQAYFETADFDADPAGFREVKHRGNIKSALRDGVLAADVIRARLCGDDPSGIVVEDAEPAAGASVAVAGIPVTQAAADGDDDSPPAASLGSERTVESGGAMLVRMLPGGVEGEEYPLPEGRVTTLGRKDCDASFPDDTAMSAQHASIVHGEDGYSLRDDGSKTGLFLELLPAAKRTLRPGDLIRCGQQFLRLDSDGSPGFTHYDARGREIGHHELREGSTVAGRQAPDITLDPDDRTLSRRQLAFSVEDGRVQVKDLKSANGSFLRVRDAVAVGHGDRFRAGHQRFMISLHDDPALSAGADPATSTSMFRLSELEVTPAPAAAPAAAAAAGDGPSVTFQGLGKTIPVSAGQTLCDAAEAAGIPITAECHAGICGSDPIRILEGREHLDADPDEQEIETLEEICELEPGDCRLACKLRVTGPVTVEVL